MQSICKKTATTISYIFRQASTLEKDERQPVIMQTVLCKRAAILFAYHKERIFKCDGRARKSAL